MMEHYLCGYHGWRRGNQALACFQAVTPKQLLKLFGERSLFQIAVDRLEGLFAPENIFIVTVAEQAEALAGSSTGDTSQ